MFLFLFCFNERPLLSWHRCTFIERPQFSWLQFLCFILRGHHCHGFNFYFFMSSSLSCTDTFILLTHSTSFLREWVIYLICVNKNKRKKTKVNVVDIFKWQQKHTMFFCKQCLAHLFFCCMLHMLFFLPPHQVNRRVVNNVP